MRKLLSVLLATLMVLAVFPMAIPQTVTAATGDRIAYFDDESGDDSTATLGDESKPYKTLKAAYNALAPEGGTLMFLSTNSVLNNADMTGLKTHWGEITITSKSDDVFWAFARYNTTAAAWAEYVFKLGGPVTIDIDLVTYKSKCEWIYANYNPITISENVNCYEAAMATDGSVTSKTQITASNGSANASNLISILGGSVNRAENYNTSVTVNGGAWRVVAGGTRSTTGTSTAPYKMNGTFFVNFNGGYSAYLFATNWQETQGGQGFVKISGGDIGQFCMGAQDDHETGYLNCTVVYTGGNIKEFKAYRGDGTKTLVYGESFTTGSAASASTFQMPKNITGGNTTYLSGVKLMTHRDPLNVMPLSYSADKVVYVSSTGSVYGNGTEADPVRYLNQAIAILSQSGGIIKLVDDYTFDSFELNSMREFNEFPHAGSIIIDGTNEGGENYKLIGMADGTYSGTSLNSASTFTDRSYGFATYVMHGNTTFSNITFNVKRDLGIAANFNEIVLDNVGYESPTTVPMRVYGGVYLYANHFTYNTDYSAAYAAYSGNDTYITVKGDNNDTKFQIYGFSRFNSGGGAKNWEVPGDWPVAYTGIANITVECGTISHIFPSVVNEQISSYETEVRKDHTAAGAVINVGGIADVDALWTGGEAAGYGSLTGDLEYNIYGNCTVNNFGAIDNCDGTRYYNISNNYLTYLKAYNKYKTSTDKLEVTWNNEYVLFTHEGFGIKQGGDDDYGLRASFSIGSFYFEENADFYNIVEMGVLVKAADNANALTYIKGKDFYPTSLDAVENTENYDPETKIAKSIVYVKGADINNYKYAGPEADDTNVCFSAPITGLSAEQLDMQFVFMPYVVLADAVDGEHIVFCGDASEAISYNSVAAEIVND